MKGLSKFVGFFIGVMVFAGIASNAIIMDALVDKVDYPLEQAKVDEAAAVPAIKTRPVKSVDMSKFDVPGEGVGVRKEGSLIQETQRVEERRTGAVSRPSQQTRVDPSVVLVN